MKLFYVPTFQSVGSLIKEEIDNKGVTFIPTALLHEDLYWLCRLGSKAIQ